MGEGSESWSPSHEYNGMNPRTCFGSSISTVDEFGLGANTKIQKRGRTQHTSVTFHRHKVVELVRGDLWACVVGSDDVS